MATQREVEELVFQRVGLPSWKWPEAARDYLRYVTKKGKAEDTVSRILWVLEREHMIPEKDPSDAG